MKRVLDFTLAFIGLSLASPILLVTIFFIWIQDWRSPFYIAPRTGKNGSSFKMVKLRSMIFDADRSGVDSTSSNDLRITTVGKFIRKYKLDELVQLWNVIIGDMSLVGPRPNVKRETDLYTIEERKLLTVNPGITDFSSIVFSDEGEILKSHDDPDIAYNQYIRPGKSMLGIFYIENRSIILDFKLIWLTIIAIVSRDFALKGVVSILKKLGANNLLIEISSRNRELVAMPPPGAKNIVTNREGRIDI